jgi:hypothetical protein
LVTLIQAAIAIARILNLGKVDEQVFASLMGNEPITLSRIEPFNRSGHSISHFLGSLRRNFPELAKPRKRKSTLALHS